MTQKVNSHKYLTSSESNEWYTPEWLINHVKRFYGGKITLDPFSNLIAQSWIDAEIFWTINSPNPLNLPSWKVRDYTKLWSNPPYGTIGGKCILKIIDEYQKNNIDEALVLVKGDSEGIRRLVKIAVWLEFNERINFVKPDGKISGSGIPGIRLFYLCKNPARRDDFDLHFYKLGTICEARKTVAYH